MKALLLFLTVVAGAAAQTTSTEIQQQAPVRDFRLPFFNPAGTRTAFLRGDEASYVSATEFRITELNFALFDEKLPRSAETVLLAPVATVSLQNKQPVISGEKSVRLIRDDIEASGEAWVYDHAAKRLSLGRNVRVVYNAELKDILK